MTSFTLSATVPASYAETVARVRDLLGDAGFGVLTEIDLTATLQSASITNRIPTSVYRVSGEFQLR